MTSLNPVLTIAEQIAEAIAAHRPAVPPGRVIELLRLVGIPDPERAARGYPHQLSGGMRQRAMIAIAVACSPALVIADEPTTALDVTIQAQILALFARLRQQLGTALLLISHDLGVVAQLADQVVVVYAGRKMEEAPVARLFAAPRHPYTQALLAATFDLLAPGPVRRRLVELPDAGDVPPGCPFASRCPHVFARCRAERPPLYPGGAAGHTAACFLLDQA